MGGQRLELVSTDDLIGELTRRSKSLVMGFVGPGLEYNETNHKIILNGFPYENLGLSQHLVALSSQRIAEIYRSSQ